MGVTIAKDQGLLLLNDVGSVMAIGPEGVKWRSPTLMLDDLRVVSVTDQTITCTGYDIEDVTVIIRTSDGSVVSENQTQ